MDRLLVYIPPPFSKIAAKAAGRSDVCKLDDLFHKIKKKIKKEGERSVLRFCSGIRWRFSRRAQSSWPLLQSSRAACMARCAAGLEGGGGGGGGGGVQALKH